MFQQLNPRLPGSPEFTAPGQMFVADPNTGILVPTYGVDGTMGRFEYDDFDLGLLGSGATQPSGGCKTFKTVTGTGAATDGITDTDGNHPGQVRLDVTALNDFASLSSMRSSASGTGKNVQLGNGPADVVWWVKSGPNLSDGTHRYFWEFGIADSFAGTPTNLVSAFYRDDVNGGAIRMRVIIGGGSTPIDGHTVVAINTWYRFRLHFNKAMNRVDLLTKVGTGPEYPECSSQSFTSAITGLNGIYGAMSKALGSGATRSVYVDRWQYGQTFSR